MHVLIINGSPRAEKYSNTDKIIDRFGKGLEKKGWTYEKMAVSNRSNWDAIREAWLREKEVVIALPLFVEAVPGLLLEFLETLPRKDVNTRLSFILQGGFAEGAQLRCGEEFLNKLPAYLLVRSGGCAVKGDNFSIRLTEGDQRDRITEPYERLGMIFAEGEAFNSAKARGITGPETFGLGKQLLYGTIFRFARSIFTKVAKQWGCTQPLDARPFEK